jgi:hypothetical protein
MQGLHWCKIWGFLVGGIRTVFLRVITSCSIMDGCQHFGGTYYFIWRQCDRLCGMYSGQSSWLHNGDVLCFLWGTNWIYICYVEESRPPLWSGGQCSWLHNGDVLCFLWGMNWIYICYAEESRLSLWSSGQSSWLQIQRHRFDSRHYQIFWEVVSLEQGPLSLVSTTEEVLGRKSIGSSLESRQYSHRDPSCWPHDTLYPQKLALT